MGRIIVLNRPGIQVLCGKVVDFGYSSITITNGGHRICVNYIPEKIEKLNLKIGSFLMATVSPTAETRKIAEGKEVPDIVPQVRAFNVRYSGAFDFAPNKNEKEAHVFSGTVCNTRLLSNGGTLITISYRCYGGIEKKFLYTPVDIRDKVGSKGIFTVGAQHFNQQNKGYYQIRSMEVV